jgi:tetratricopeptide (TPR) repeat protein
MKSLRNNILLACALLGAIWVIIQIINYFSKPKSENKIIYNIQNSTVTFVTNNTEFRTYGNLLENTPSQIKEELGINCSETTKIICEYIDSSSILIMQTKYNDAEALLANLISIYPKSSLLHFNLALVFHAQNKIENALSEYYKAIFLNKRCLEAFYQLGVLYESEHKYDLAINNYKAVLTIDSTFSWALNNLGFIMLAKGDTGTALAYLESSTSYKGDHNYELTNIGTVYYMLNDYQKAINKWKLVNFDSVDVQTRAYIHNYIGLALIDLGDTIKAVDEFKKALIADPGYGWANFNMAQYFYLKDQPKEAIKFYETITQDHPRYFYALMRLGELYFGQKNYNAGEIVLNKALNIIPHDSLTINNLASCLMEQDKYNETIDLYKKEIPLSENNATYHNNLGAAYFYNKNYIDALKEFKTAAKLDPYNLTTRDNINRLNSILARKKNYT